MKTTLALIAAVLVLGGCRTVPPPPFVPDLPRVTAPFGTDEWFAEVKALNIAEHAKRAEIAKAQMEATAAKMAAQKAQNELKSGKEAAKSSLITAATWVGWFGGLVALGAGVGIVISILSGRVALGRCVMALGVSAASMLVRFFILAYGYAVSMTACWIILVALAGLTVFFGVLGIQALYRLWNARQLAHKRASDGDDARDAFALMPIRKSLKGPLHDAYEYLRDPAPGDSLVERNARRLLAHYRLPLPRPGAGPASAGAGGGLERAETP
jgi:hypothetical protein